MAGSSATTTGFIWSPGFGFESINDPDGVGSTTINGVNDRRTLVGFYTDSAGNTDGLVAPPAGVLAPIALQPTLASSAGSPAGGPGLV